MYLLISLFKHYNINPIFIFDGKPPTEKKALLQKRKMNKINAEKEYNTLKEEMNNEKNDLTIEDKKEILTCMDLLKKDFVYIKKDQIKMVKELITSYGAVYYDAPGEADKLCAQLVIKNKVWACMSEDMDMFVYGATRVLRYFSLLNHTVVVYDTGGILKDLGITQKELTEICVLASNDYNDTANDAENKDKIDLYDVLKVFRKFLKRRSNNDEFYSWIMKANPSYIKDYNKLMKIYDIFALDQEEDIINNMEIIQNKVDNVKLKEILTEDGFVYTC
jgi:5'-3' exonuclease